MRDFYIQSLDRDPALLNTKGSAVQGLSPNDIIATIGTLIGFLFTAYALLANANLPPSTLRTISGIEFAIMAFFILTGFLAAFAAAADKPQALALALGIYPASWVGLALGIGLIFLAIIFPQFPIGEYAPALAVAVGGSITAVVASTNSIGIYRALERIRLEALEASATADTAARVPPQGATDFTTAFLEEAAQLESRLRELFQSINPRPVTDPLTKVASVLHDKGKLGDDDYRTLRALWRVRNLVVHGSGVAERDLGACVKVASRLEAKLVSLLSGKGPQGGA